MSRQQPLYAPPDCPERTGRRQGRCLVGRAYPGYRTAAPRRALLDDLRAQIRAIEGAGRRSSAINGTPRKSRSRKENEPGAPGRWTLGVAKIDHALPAGGLEIAGLHEIKPPVDGASACNHAAALGFMMRLLTRRLMVMQEAAEAPRPILCCWPAFAAHELGGLYGPGLGALGLDPSRLLIVGAAKAADALWAMEEGLKSGALAAVAGLVDELGFTPARRLALAAQGHGTPCLVLTAPRRSAAGPALTRWRVGPALSARHGFDAGAPGRARFALTLERCRHGAGAAASLEDRPCIVEWSDEAHRFHLASGLADRTADESLPRSRAG